MTEKHASRENPLPGAFIKLNGLNIHTVRMGQGSPLLFLHGLPTSSYLWRNVQRPLSASFQTIAPDLMGLGKSDSPTEGPLGLPEQANMILALMNHLELERVVLVAHEIGGGAAQILTANHPERVRGLVLLDTVALAEYWPVGLVRFLRLPLAGSSLPKIPASVLRFKLRGFIKKGLFHKELLTETMFAEYSDIFMDEQKRPALLRMIRSFDPRGLQEAGDRLKTIRMPKLFLWADNDAYLPLESGQKFFDGFPSGKFVHVSKAGHFLPEDQPDRVVNEIKTFLSGLR